MTRGHHMATGKQLKMDGSAPGFFVVRQKEIHRIREVKAMVQALLLVAMGLCAGCYTAGGEPVDLLGAIAEAGERKLTAQEIADRVRESEKVRVEITGAGVVYEFERDIVIDDLDEKGNLKRRQTRKFRSFTDNRDPVLLLHDGKKPTPEQMEKERKKISKHQRKFLGGKESDKSKNSRGDEKLLVRQIERYGDHFIPRLLGEGTFEGRPAYILQFLHNPEKTFRDPLVDLALQHLLIKVWVDQEEFQIAQLKAELANPLYALGGLAGKLETFQLTAMQKRLTPEIWADWKVSVAVHGRMLWDPFTIHFRSESSGFKRLKASD